MLIRRLAKCVIGDLLCGPKDCGQSATVDPGMRMIVVLLAVVFLGCSSRCVAENRSPAAVCGDQLIFRKIDSLIRQDDFSDAKKTLYEVSSCHNLTALGEFRLGWLYVETGDFELALKEFQQVSRNVPTIEGHAYAIAFAQFHLGKFDAAKKTLLPLERSNSLDQEHDRRAGPRGACGHGLSWSQLPGPDYGARGQAKKGPHAAAAVALDETPRRHRAQHRPSEERTPTGQEPLEGCCR